MTFNKLEKVKKILAIIAFSLLIIALIIVLKTPPASIYEISIYNAYPWYLWFLILSTIIIGELIVFIEILSDSSEKKYKTWNPGLIAIFIPIIIILILPIIRGYPTYGFGDHLTHIGEIKDILKFGSIGKNNFYPNLHIYTANSILVTGSFINIINLISRYFFFFIPISIYLFYKIVFNNKDEMKFALIFASSFLFFGSLCRYLAPYDQSFLITPIILYLYFKRGNQKNTTSFSILFMIFVISYTFYHPLNLLMLILVFLFLTIIFYLYRKINFLKVSEVPEKKLKEKSLNIVLFSIFLFLIWYFSFSFIVGSFLRVFSSIFYGAGESLFEIQTSAVVSYSPKLIDTFRILMLNYGSLLIIGLLSVLSLFYIFIKWQRNKKNFDLRFCFLLSVITFLFFGLLLTGAIFSDLLVDWNRFMIWETIFSIILVTIAFYSFFINSKNRKIVKKPFKKIIATITVCIALISLTFLSIFTFYPSPLISDANLQVTNMDWNGAEWIMQHSNEKIKIDQLGISLWRFYNAINGIKNYPIDYIFEPPPDHFNYQNNNTLGEYYNNNRYIIISHLAKIRYPESYPNYKELWRFTPDDFNLLQSDYNVNRFFDNKGFEAYFIK
jgi:hypothetical protein